MAYARSMAPLVVLGVSAALMVLAALVAPTQRVVSVALAAVVMLVLPWFAGATPLIRGLFALNFISVFRIIDVVRSRDGWSASRRVAHAMSFVDTRLLRREPPRVDARAIGAGLVWAGIATGALLAVRALGPYGLVVEVARLGAGLVFTYAAIEAGYTLIRAGHHAAGFVPPPLHVWPLASLTIAEFWGSRWARPVSHWLRSNCFLPLARRRRPALGVLLCFVVSGFTHAYPVLVAIGPAMAGVMFGYFAVQGLAVAAEARLGTARWPRAARRAWSVIVMVASSPLFVEPCLRVVLGEDQPGAASSDDTPSAWPSKTDIVGSPSAGQTTSTSNVSASSYTLKERSASRERSGSSAAFSGGRPITIAAFVPRWTVANPRPNESSSTCPLEPHPLDEIQIAGDVMTPSSSTRASLSRPRSHRATQRR